MTWGAWRFCGRQRRWGQLVGCRADGRESALLPLPLPLLEIVEGNCASVWQVADALNALHINFSGSSIKRAADSSAAHPADGTAAAAGAAAAFVGQPGTCLGVSQADLLAEALPPEEARQAALHAVLPALEAALVRRCSAVAAACGYESSTDFTGLPDHIRQLQAAADQQAASQGEVWSKAVAQAGEAVGLLMRSSQLLAGIVDKHKLTSRKEADEAQAAGLRSECVFLQEKLQTVQLQLQAATYSADTVKVLRQVAAEVERALAEATAQLQQASSRLAQYRSLGPEFAALAAEHGAVLEDLEEAEYELQEIEQFRALSAVNG